MCRPTAKPLSAPQTASAWKWHTTCPKSGYEADGEAIFTDPENYTVQSTSVSKVGDKVRSSRTTMTAKWLGSDCGGVQPLDVQALTGGHADSGNFLSDRADFMLWYGEGPQICDSRI